MSKNNPKDIEVTPVSSQESQHRLDAIKNLIFGENIQQIDAEFDSIKNHIEKRKDELENYIQDTSKELNMIIDNLSTDLNIRITNLEENMSDKMDILDQNKVDRNTIGNLLISMGEKIMKN